ncbi:MAG: RNA polymerase sigma factor [Planctomycetota bacterium]
MTTLTYIEPETVVLAQQGDQEATRRIIEDMHQPILAFAYRMLGPAYRGEMEDIAQEIFLRLFRALDRFDVGRGVKFTTWAFTFVRNYCLDVMKKRRLRTMSLTAEDGDETQWALEDESAMQPERHAWNQEILGKVDEALSQISSEQRDVFVMREQKGMDYGEIATRTGVPEGTVKSRLHRARLALRGLLAELDPGREPAMAPRACCA